MTDSSLQALVQAVLHRVEWEKDLHVGGYGRPAAGAMSQSDSRYDQNKQVEISRTPASAQRHIMPPKPGAAVPMPVADGSASQPHPPNRPVVVNPGGAQGAALPSQPPTPLIEQNRAHALAALKFRLETCTECGLSSSRSRIVFSDGTMTASIAFVGDAPSREEELVSLPFIGPRGHLLNKIILAIGQRRETSYLCNVVKCATDKGAAPTTTESDTCKKHLFEQLKQVSPKVIVALGQVPASVLLQTNDSLVDLRGKFHNWNGISVMPTWSLDHMLQNPQSKRDAWEDLKQVKRLLET